MMRIKKFTGPNIAKSLALAKQEMGEDALILSTMRRRKGAEVVVEIVAANNKALETARDLPGPPARNGGSGEEAPGSPATSPQGLDTGIVRELEQVESRLNAILAKLVPAPSDDRGRRLGELRVNLHNAGFDPGLVQRRFLKREPGPWSSFESYLEDLVADVPLEIPEERVSIFVGPSGSGKTTALLKIAAVLKKRGMQPRVVYFGEDANGEARALRSRCRKLGIRPKIISSAKKLLEEVERSPDSPVLIDTSGMASVGDERLDFLAGLTRRIDGAVIRLVIDSAMDPLNISMIASCVPGPARMSLVLTKLDEATRIGGAISAAMKENIPVAYLTGGRDIESGVFVPDRELLCDKILEGLAVGAGRGS